jgi:glycosyltransferase involved in cell wall biosynthesis
VNIALFTDSYLPTRDGTAVVVDGLARTLAKEGHQVSVYAPRSHRGPTDRVEEEGVTIVRVRSHAVPLYPQYRSPYAASLLGALRAEKAGREADIVHLHTPGLVGTAGFLLGRRFHRPLVGTFHTHLQAMVESVPPQLGVKTFFRIAGFYSLGLYWRCDRTTAPTTIARQALLDHATKPFRHPIEVIPNGIDIHRFRPGVRVPDWRARCGLNDAPLVTYLGRLTTDKGIHRFLDAVSEALRTTDLVAIVGGSGPEEAAVRQRLAEDPLLGPRVRYVGPVVEEEKPALLAQSDLFVLPSTSDTASVVLLEAMACGAAVIGPSMGGASEIIEDGVTGLKVPPLLPGALASAIARLVERTDERRRLADTALRTVDRTASIDAMTSRYVALYRGLRENRRPAPAAL